MTNDEASSLRRWDKIKYIGPIYKKDGTYRHTYLTCRRRVMHVAKPPYMHVAEPGKPLRWWISISPQYTESIWFNPEDWTLVERWSISRETLQARKHVPKAIKGLVKAIKRQQEAYKVKIDDWLAQVPLHEKLQILGGLTEEERRIYDFMYSDVENVIKENETNKGEE
jgi:hypothetical protein